MDKITFSTGVVDQLALLELQIRGAGAWCHVYNDLGDTHYFICRNDRSSLAISLCRAMIKPIKDLTIIAPEHKCFVCSCFAHSRETLIDQSERVERGRDNEELEDPAN
jgi:hypothetical protein